MKPETAQKIVDALRGSRIGAVVACALDLERDATPRFTSKAIVTSDGFLQANFVDGDGVARHSAFVGSFDELKENMRGVQKYLNKHHGIDEDVLHELWNAVVYDWIATDYRSLQMSRPM